MLQVFCINVAKADRDAVKVDWDIAHVAMAIHVCFKCMFQMFHTCLIEMIDNLAS